jgi:hypothetical protein
MIARMVIFLLSPPTQRLLENDYIFHCQEDLFVFLSKYLVKISSKILLSRDN